MSRATSVVLPRDATKVEHTLFTIGRTTVTADCFDNGSGGVQMAVSVTSGDSEPVLVTPFGHVPVKDSDPIILTGNPDAVQTQFSILDAQGVSATGLAAASVQSASGPCTITAQAAG